MNSWQKPFLKFVAVAAINAGAFVAYRLHIHNKKKKKEPVSIVAASNVKVYMKLDDPTETFDLFENLEKEDKLQGVESTTTELKSRKHKKPSTVASKNVKVVMDIKNPEETYALFEKSVNDAQKKEAEIISPPVKKRMRKPKKESQE